jgi:hypothetical protein
MEFIPTICTRCNYKDEINQDVTNWICNNCKKQGHVVFQHEYFAGIPQGFIDAAGDFCMAQENWIGVDLKKLAQALESMYWKGKDDQRDDIFKQLEGALHMFAPEQRGLVRMIASMIKNPIPDPMHPAPDVPTFPPAKNENHIGYRWPFL